MASRLIGVRRLDGVETRGRRAKTTGDASSDSHPELSVLSESDSEATAPRRARILSRRGLEFFTDSFFGVFLSLTLDKLRALNKSGGRWQPPGGELVSIVTGAAVTGAAVTDAAEGSVWPLTINDGATRAISSSWAVVRVLVSETEAET